MFSSYGIPEYNHGPPKEHPFNTGILNSKNPSCLPCSFSMPGEWLKITCVLFYYLRSYILSTYVGSCINQLLRLKIHLPVKSWAMEKTVKRCHLINKHSYIDSMGMRGEINPPFSPHGPSRGCRNVEITLRNSTLLQLPVGKRISILSPISQRCYRCQKL